MHPLPRPVTMQRCGEIAPCGPREMRATARRSRRAGLLAALAVLPGLLSAAEAGAPPCAATPSAPPRPATQAPRVAAPPDAAALAARVRAVRRQRERQILEQLRALVALPNVAANRADIARNAAFLRTLFEQRGFTTMLLEAGAARPAVYAERTTPGATQTVMFYAHYDGQPVDAAQWHDPPWEATLRTAPHDAGGSVIPWDALPDDLPAEARLYGRSTSDDKGPIVAYLAALDALAAIDVSPSVNLKVFLEGEEEVGSPHLAALLRAHAPRLAADVWIFGDGPVHQSRRPLVSFGVRGTLDLELTLFGPARALHSGHYGNWAPNPAAELATLLSSMRDDEGRILIEGVADRVRPLEPAERAASASAPDIDASLATSLALGRTEQAAPTLVDSLLLPALNIRGLRAGQVGDAAANAIPVQAQASIDFRLVPDLRPADVRALVEAHLRRRGYHVVHEPPTPGLRRQHRRLVQLDWGTGYPAYRTSLTLPVAQRVVRIVGEARGEPAVVVPTMGGSLPLYLFADVLGATIITVPIVNHDNNQHAANEHVRVQNLWDGIETYAALIAHLGQPDAPESVR